jgi:hypothetical protein
MDASFRWALVGGHPAMGLVGLGTGLETSRAVAASSRAVMLDLSRQGHRHLVMPMEAYPAAQAPGFSLIDVMPPLASKQGTSSDA